MRTRYFLSFLLFCISYQFQAQSPAIEWQKMYGGADGETLDAMMELPDGGYIFAGTSDSGISGNKTVAGNGNSDYWIIRTNNLGEILWQKNYGGSGNDIFYNMASTADGGFILGGNSSSPVSGDKTAPAYGDSDFWIVKVDSEGNKEWDKSYGGDDTDNLFSIDQSSDGGYILGGGSTSGVSGVKNMPNLGEWDYWVIKINPSGNIEWQKTFGGEGFETVEEVKTTSDGGFIVGGYSSSGITSTKSEASMGDVDYWIIKLNVKGNIEWENTIGGDDWDFFLTLEQTKDGGYILGGESASGISGDKSENLIESSIDFWAVKIDANGQVEWDRTLGGDDDDSLLAIDQTRDGGFIFGGLSYSSASGNKTEDSEEEDFWIVKLDACGEISWDKTIGTGLEESLNALIQSADGGYVLGGYSGSFQNPPGLNYGDYDYFVVKLEGCAATYSESTLTLCNENFTAPCGKVFDTSGDYEYAMTNATGCDSMITLHLTVVEDFDDQISTTLNGLMATETDVEYQWMDCATGTPVAGATGQEFIPTVDGTYQAQITKNGCSKMSACMFWEVSDIGLFGSNIDIEGVYPNPTEGAVVVELEKVMENVTVKVYNTMGQIVRHQEYGTTGKFNLNLPEDNGLYIINVKGASGRERNFKVFKQ